MKKTWVTNFEKCSVSLVKYKIDHNVGVVDVLEINCRNLMYLKLNMCTVKY